MTVMPSVAILAGGLATRLHPLTISVPKAMVVVAGEPFIAHQLRLLRRNGVSHVVLCVGYLADQIRAFVGDGTRFGLIVDYREDGEKLLGTGGALRAACDLLGREFLVMYGDSWLDTAYSPIVEAFHASNQPALMTVFRNQHRWDKSNVWLEDNRIRLYDKTAQLPQMQHIDWGLSMIRTDVLMQHEEGEAFDIADLYGNLSREGRLASHEVTIRFYEIGSREGIAEIDRLLREKPKA